ncbi:MAG: helix-turn-helix transcriptional regulator [Pyrinomonadaceae bacterium]|nr:helix-turn-helix transcriptional regulator [Pyrinomonadaceae bacterium]
MRIELQKMLAQRGRSLYWLGQKSGVRYATLLGMREGKAIRVSLSDLEALCKALNCTPGELLTLTQGPKRRSGIKGKND